MGRFRTGSRRTVATRVFLLAAVTLGLAGCDASEWGRGALPVGITEESMRVTNLWRGAWIAALVVGIGVWGLILWCCAAYRRRRNESGLPPQVRYNVPIEVLYTVLPFIIIIVLFFFTAQDESAMAKVTLGPVQNEISVVGKQWSWDFNYTTGGVFETGTPSEPPTLFLPKGERVRFTLTSRDVIHSFWVVPFLYKQDVIPGRINRFEVVPNRIGRFRGKCAEFCGQDHSRMLFNVEVVEPAVYQAHLADLRARGNVGSLPATLGPNGSFPQSIPEKEHE